MPSCSHIIAKWTEEGSRSCQFILLLNIRTIHTISRLLGDEIEDLIRRRTAESGPHDSGTSGQGETEGNFTPTFSRILPLLRVYMTWLCAYGSELVEFQAHLEPHFGVMCAALSNTLTLLLGLLGSGTLGTTVPWRLPEDEMTLGIKCLNGHDLHAGCQLYYDAFKHQPKPRREDVPGAEHTDDDVTFTRALDVVFCAIDLCAPESKFPLATSTATGGRATVVYLDGGKPSLARRSQAAQPAQVAMPSAEPSNMEQQPGKVPGPPSLCESNELSEDREFYGPSLGNGRSRARNAQVAPAVAAAQPAPVSEFAIETQLFHILNDFLAPPESASTTKSEPQNRPLAQPLATTASESSGATSTSPGPGSAGVKAIPTLPWNYFYTPEPVDSTMRKSSLSGATPGWGADGSGSPRPASSGAAAQLGAGAMAGNPLATQTHNRYGSLGRTLALETQTQATRSSVLGAQLKGGSNLQEPGIKGAWPGAGEGLTSIGMAPNPLRHNPWAPSAADQWQTGRSQQSAFSHVPNSSFSTFQFSENSSSLPPVNSPLGLPSRAAQIYASSGVSSTAATQSHSPQLAVHTADPVMAAVYAQQEALLRAASPWSNVARMPRSSAATQPVQKSAAGPMDSAERKQPMIHGMPKR